jgi:hypothetical protein
VKLFLVALVALALRASGDIVVVQHVEGGGQSGDQTIRVKGGKARCDIGGAVSVIVDRETGESTTLAHAQRGFLTLTPERTRGMIERMRKSKGVQDAPQLVPTGKKEKIGEYMCDISTTDLGAVKVTYWLAADYPNYQSFTSQLDVLESAPTATGGIAPRTKDLPGMPMKMLMEMAAQKITVTLTSAKEENVDPAIFKIPAGYREMPAPPVPASAAAKE